jgi:hypothetical protein
MTMAFSDDLLTGGAEIARFLYADAPNGVRRVYHFIEMTDKAIAAGDESCDPFPFTRRRGLVISRKSWLMAWLGGERVDVPPGDPKKPPGMGRPRKAAEPEPPAPRNSARTGRPVRKYVRRQPDPPGAGP